MSRKLDALERIITMPLETETTEGLVKHIENLLNVSQENLQTTRDQLGLLQKMSDDNGLDNIFAKILEAIIENREAVKRDILPSLKQKLPPKKELPLYY